MELGHMNHGTTFGTIGGTLISIFAIPSTATIIDTIILAIIGAVASFFTTLLIKKIIVWYHKHFTK